MAVIGILGRQSHEAAHCLRVILKGAGCLQSFSIINFEQGPEMAAVDILVAAGGSDKARDIIEYQTKEHFFIMNPDQKDILACTSYSRGLLITYGFNSKVCVTASSVMENEMQICVQREIPTLKGSSIHQQEFGMSMDTESHSPENLLAAITAALVADVQVMVLK